MSNQAELYQRVSVGQFHAGLELIEMAQPKSGEFVLDVGSGTGNLTFELAQKISPNGKVYAIEPDIERVAIAKQQQPGNISNIIWYAGTLESFNAPKVGMFHLAYSNYVFHWIKNQQAAVQSVYTHLVPGGRFAFCCVFGMPQIIRDLCAAIGTEGNDIVASLHFIPKEQWLNYFVEAGFEIKIINEVADYEFDNIDEVMIWLEATTHGKFAINKLSASTLIDLKRKYPGKIAIYQNETLRLVAVKKM